MAIVGSVTVTGTVAGAQSGSRTFGPAQISIGAGVDAVTQIALIVGNTTVTVPSGATVCIIAPPNLAVPAPNPAYGGTITLKGVVGDTGVSLSNKYPTVLTWDTAPASFVLTGTATGTAEAWFA